MNQLDEALAAANTGRLKQLKQSLSTKMKILAKMEDELLQLVEEEQLETEIEESDLFREKAELAIIAIDEALLRVGRNEQVQSGETSRASSHAPVKEKHP